MDSAQREAVEAVADLVKNEVNVKDIKIVDNEESGLVKRVKADFKKLGPRYGKIMKDLGKAITAMSQKEIAVLEKEGRFAFEALPGVPVVTTEDVEIIPEDVPGWLVANDGSITVALDVTITPGLRNEGMARELVNRIQNIRKSQDFEITDKVVVTLSPADEVKEAVEAFGRYIASQVLAGELVLAEPGDGAVELDIDGLSVRAKVEKI